MATAIPTNLVTGFLGVGKTTALLHLLKQRPSGSKWGVIVNEYGDVGIDGALLSDASQGSVEIQEVAGGCICCTSALYFRFTLAQMLSQVQPERLLIETTGVAHPARLIEDLRKPVYQGRIDLRSTLCVVDPHDFRSPTMKESPVFRDQIELADVLILNKKDKADANLQKEFLDWGRSLFPPKSLVTITEQGQLDSAWLDRDTLPTRTALFPDWHAEEHHHHTHEEEPTQIPMPKPGKPYRKESTGLGHQACGWIFHPQDQFIEEQLVRLFVAFPQIKRLKGIFHVQEGWIMINRSGNDTEVKPTLYEKDSRLEIFADNLPGGWSSYETHLLNCLVKQS